jgi:hypothetical protein
MKSITLCGALLAAATRLTAQPSPAQTATASIGGKAVTIKYSAPSVKGRKIFGEGGLVMKDPGAPVWRAGANAATALHLDGDFTIGGLAVPAGDYTLYVNVKDPDKWELVVNKKTGQWGIPYKEGTDLGRVKMTMSKPPALVETLKYTVTDLGGGKGKIDLEWENHAASVSVIAK